MPRVGAATTFLIRGMSDVYSGHRAAAAAAHVPKDTR